MKNNYEYKYLKYKEKYYKKKNHFGGSTNTNGYNLGPQKPNSKPLKKLIPDDIIDIDSYDIKDTSIEDITTKEKIMKLKNDIYKIFSSIDDEFKIAPFHKIMMKDYNISRKDLIENKDLGRNIIELSNLLTTFFFTPNNEKRKKCYLEFVKMDKQLREFNKNVDKDTRNIKNMDEFYKKIQIMYDKMELYRKQLSMIGPNFMSKLSSFINNILSGVKSESYSSQSINLLSLLGNISPSLSKMLPKPIRILSNLTTIDTKLTSFLANLNSKTLYDCITDINNKYNDDKSIYDIIFETSGNTNIQNNNIHNLFNFIINFNVIKEFYDDVKSDKIQTAQTGGSPDIIMLIAIAYGYAGTMVALFFLWLLLNKIYEFIKSMLNSSKDASTT
jgi:hypothetical protein